MRLATIRVDGATAAAVLRDDEYVVLPFADVAAFLAVGRAATSVRPSGTVVGREDAVLAPVVTAPRRVVCTGLNYIRHIDEMGHGRPEHPTLFTKFASSLCGPHDPIALPPESDQVDWEAELAVVIGTAGRRIAPADALAHVGGYCVVNDVSMRDWQRRSSQWLGGKAFDASTPIGPHLVTPDELPAGASGLRITCAVDGVTKQDDTTADLLFDVATLIATVSTFTRLEPGDVIVTGTPGGVGAGRTPTEFLRPGQVLWTEVEGIGALENRIVGPV